MQHIDLQAYTTWGTRAVISACQMSIIVLCLGEKEVVILFENSAMKC